MWDLFQKKPSKEKAIKKVVIQLGNHEFEKDEEILEKPIEEVMDYIID
jgi:hypothetical protein